MYYGHLTLLSRLVIDFSLMCMSEDKCKCIGLDDTSYYLGLDQRPIGYIMAV